MHRRVLGNSRIKVAITASTTSCINSAARSESISRKGAHPYQNYQGFLDRQLAHSQLYVKLRTRYPMWKHDVGPEGQVESKRELVDHWEPLGLAQYRLNVELVTDGARNIGATPVLLTQASL